MARTKPSVAVESLVDGQHAELTADKLPADAHLVVELVYPSRSVTYNHGSDHDGGLRLAFPVLEQGEVLVRIFSADADDPSDQERRELVCSGRFDA